VNEKDARMSGFGRRIVLWTILVPLIVFVCLLLSPVLLAFTLIRSIKYARFCWTHHRQVFLVCDTRHAWHDFICNNVACVLRPSVRLIWYNRRHANPEWRKIAFVGRPGFPKPYFVYVTWLRLRFVSVNTRLRGFKRRTRKNTCIQKQVSTILEEALLPLCGQ
jgi:hypothetical protein